MNPVVQVELDNAGLAEAAVNWLKRCYWERWGHKGSRHRNAVIKDDILKIDWNIENIKLHLDKYIKQNYYYFS